jgi:hypothetical protein
MEIFNQNMPCGTKQEGGSALVLVLGVVVIISALVVALVLASKIERLSAFHYAERVRASFMAQEAVATSQMMLGAAFAKPDTHVASSPGQLIVRPAGTNAWTSVGLSSGISASAAADDSVDLNRPVLSGDKLPIIDPLGGEMRVGWVYVRKDGTRATGAVPTYNAANPVVGRYAFWVDDETTRVNLNTAHRRQDNGFVLSQVDLSTVGTNVTPAMADAIKNSAVVRPFQSLGEATRVGADVGAGISTNRFNFTHYNRSSYLNPWGEPKIFLTTQLSNLPPEIRNLPAAEREKYFFDILTSPTADPSRNSSINYTKLTRLLSRLNALLEREDWPLAPGKSFYKKYKGYSQPAEKRITQLALDIVQYVRSVESDKPTVSQIRGRWNGDNFVSATTQEDVVVGTARAPLITEVAAWVSAQRGGPDNAYDCQFRFEVFLPPGYGVDSVNLADFKFLIQATGSTIFQNTPITAAMASPLTLQRGDYAVITTPVVPMLTAATPAMPGGAPFTEPNLSRMYLRVVLLNAFNDFVDQATVGNRNAALGTSDASGIEYPLERPLPSVPALEEMPSAEVDDPRMNKSRLGWIRRSSGSSFGGPNSVWKTSPPAEDGLPQDKDGSVFSDASLVMPGPKGSAGNTLGRVRSVAELGRIPTGIETHGAHKDKNAAWRTLRLQPTTEGDTTIPDWMLLELFAAPVVPEASREPVVYSNGYQIGGQVNVNAAVAPFAGMEKKESLGALFGDANHPAIPNILAGTRATGGRTFGGSGLLATVGELAEIKGVADSGEQSEENLRRIASQATTQGRTFRVFAVGESISQAPSGQITVHASRTVEALLAPAPDANPVVFKPVTWQLHSL